MMTKQRVIFITFQALPPPGSHSRTPLRVCEGLEAPGPSEWTQASTGAPRPTEVR